MYVHDSKAEHLGFRVSENIFEGIEPDTEGEGIRVLNEEGDYVPLIDIVLTGCELTINS